MYDQLKKHLEAHKGRLRGDWIGKRSSYDIYICAILEMKGIESRYWDGEWNGLLLEFKKGRSIWVDLVRYSEILLGSAPKEAIETLTLFFIPAGSKDRIEEIIAVETKALIEKFALTADSARALVQLNKQVPRQLNAQASLTVKDIRGVAIWEL
jgi:hypothetical protein